MKSSELSAFTGPFRRAALVLVTLIQLSIQGALAASRGILVPAVFPESEQSSPALDAAGTLLTYQELAGAAGGHQMLYDIASGAQRDLTSPLRTGAASGYVTLAAIAQNGSAVAFDFRPEDENGASLPDVLAIYDVATSALATLAVPLENGESQSDVQVDEIVLSRDGRYLAIVVDMTPPDFTATEWRLYVYDRVSAQVTRIAVPVPSVSDMPPRIFNLGLVAGDDGIFFAVRDEGGSGNLFRFRLQPADGTVAAIADSIVTFPAEKNRDFTSGTLSVNGFSFLDSGASPILSARIWIKAPTDLAAAVTLRGTSHGAPVWERHLLGAVSTGSAMLSPDQSSVGFLWAPPTRRKLPGVLPPDSNFAESSEAALGSIGLLDLSSGAVSRFDGGRDVSYDLVVAANGGAVLAAEERGRSALSRIRILRRSDLESQRCSSRDDCFQPDNAPRPLAPRVFRSELAQGFTSFGSPFAVLSPHRHASYEVEVLYVRSLDEANRSEENSCTAWSTTKTSQNVLSIARGTSPVLALPRPAYYCAQNGNEGNDLYKVRYRWIFARGLSAWSPWTTFLGAYDFSGL